MAPRAAFHQDRTHLGLKELQVRVARWLGNADTAADQKPGGSDYRSAQARRDLVDEQHSVTVEAGGRIRRGCAWGRVRHVREQPTGPRFSFLSINSFDARCCALTERLLQEELYRISARQVLSGITAVPLPGPGSTALVARPWGGEKALNLKNRCFHRGGCKAIILQA